MIVGKDNLNEIISGIYASEDKKTIVLDVFALTTLDRTGLAAAAEVLPLLAVSKFKGSKGVLL